LVELEFELRASSLQSRCSIAAATLPFLKTPFFFLICTLDFERRNYMLILHIAGGKKGSSMMGKN
jgi:hypothetical protein